MNDNVFEAIMTIGAIIFIILVLVAIVLLVKELVETKKDKKIEKEKERFKERKRETEYKRKLKIAQEEKRKIIIEKEKEEAKLKEKSNSELIKELETQYSERGNIHYKLNDNYYFVINLPTNEFKGYYLNKGKREKLMEFNIDDVTFIADKEDYTAMLYVGHYYLPKEHAESIEEINSLYAKLKNKDYGNNLLHFNPAESKNRKIYGEEYIFNKYIENNLLKKFKRNTSEYIEKELLKDGVYSQENLMMINRFFIKYLQPIIGIDNILKNSQMQIVSNYPELKNIPYNLKDHIQREINIEEKEDTDTLTQSFNNLVNLVNSSGKNEKNYDTIFIFLLLKLKVNESIIKLFKSDLDLTDKEIKDKDMKELLRSAILDYPENLIMNMMAIAIIKSSPQNSIGENFIRLADLNEEIFQELELERFKEDLLLDNEKKIDINQLMSEIDFMDGYQFEEYIATIYRKKGYTATVTKSSGDQGVDVIITDNLGYKIGIQTKRSGTKITNSSVQEIYSGINYYDCFKGIVITNNYFTPSAVSLAEHNNIELINRTRLFKMLDYVHNELS